MNVTPPSGGIHLPFMKNIPNRSNERRVPGFGWLPNMARNHFIAMMGEFSGTFLFLFFAFSATQVANADAASSTTSALLFIALAFGFSLAVNAWVFFRITGGLFNPAVTLGLCLIGAVGWVRGGLVFIAQILGSMAAAAVVSVLFPGPMSVATTLSNGTSIVRGLFIEMFLTSMLVLTIFMLAAEKHKGTFLAPIGIGLALFIAELSGVYFTGGSLNPARSFGPAVVLHSFPGEHWIYWVGPALGACLAVGFYRLVKTLEYETVNPGQDFDDKEAEAFEPDEVPARASDVARPNVVLASPDYVAGMAPVASRVAPTVPVRYDATTPAHYDGASADLHMKGKGKGGKPLASANRFESASQVESGTMGDKRTV